MLVLLRRMDVAGRRWLGPARTIVGWVAAHMFCPHCDAERLRALLNNWPVGDSVCDACVEEFELKAGKARWGRNPRRRLWRDDEPAEGAQQS